ncbi:MAG: hypothetical protein QF381_02865 [Nitrososphaerales archaeon]|nr:hypothetical protein [Nitrososphaerales archaeon]
MLFNLIAVLFIPIVNAADCRTTSTGLIPITEMNDELYRGKEGGLYPNGNTPPVEFQNTGIETATDIQPLDTYGKPSITNGTIVLLSIGMSITSMEFLTFRQLSLSDPLKNPNLVLVNGAIEGVGATSVANKNSTYWNAVENRLKINGVSVNQVQIVWLKEVSRSSKGFPEDAETLTELLKTIVQVLKEKYPNISIVYISSRSYGGYTTNAALEPYSYQTGFSVKWLIESQINGDLDINYDPMKGPVKAPLLRWGPYLWADGTTIRKDNNLSWQCFDYSDDGVHPSSSGLEKSGNLLLNFFQTDPTARIWYLSEDAKNEIIDILIFPAPFPFLEIFVAAIAVVIGIIVIRSVWQRKKTKDIEEEDW